jgi:DNA-binding transcriptional MerR regulator
VKNPLGTKLYYTISEVAELTQLQPYTLRAWEKEFSCLRPKRARGKNRAYRERDIGIVLLIKHLLYDERYTSQGVKQRLKSEPELLREAAGDLSTMLDPKARSRILAGDAHAPPHGPASPLESASVPDPAPVVEAPTHCPATPERMRDVLESARRELRLLLELL